MPCQFPNSIKFEFSIIKSFNINLEVAFTSNDEFLRFSLMFDFAFIDLFSKILMGAYRIGRRKALGDKY